MRRDTRRWFRRYNDALDNKQYIEHAGRSVRAESLRDLGWSPEAAAAFVTHRGKVFTLVSLVSIFLFIASGWGGIALAVAFSLELVAGTTCSYLPITGAAAALVLFFAAQSWASLASDGDRVNFEAKASLSRVRYPDDQNMPVPD